MSALLLLLAVSMPLRLNDSSSLIRPPVDVDPVDVTPASFASWAALESSYAGTGRTVRLTPGSYVSWGQPAFSAAWGNSKQPQLVRFYDPGQDHLHPVKRTSHAYFADGPRFNSGCSYLMVSGFTVTGQTAARTVWSGTQHHNIADFFLMEGTENDAAVRILSGYAWLQRAVVRSPGAGAPSDGVAVQLRSVNGAGLRTVRVLDCELYDFSDELAFTDDATDSWAPYDDILIEGNHGYVTLAKYNGDGTATTENIVDVKAGASYPGGIVFRGNIWRGSRRTVRNGVTTSDGTAVAFHRYARHIRVYDDIIADAPGGYQELGWVDGVDENTPRNIELIGLRVHDIRDRSGSDHGAAFRLLNNTAITRARIVRSDALIYTQSAPTAGGPTLTGSVRAEVDVVNHPDSAAVVTYAEPPNLEVTRALTYDTYEWKRWTGPEFAEGAYEVSTCTYAQIRDEQARLVEAITPTSAAQVKFQREEGRIDFRQWAQANPSACFRRFAIMGSQRLEGPLVTNTDVETYRTDTIVVLAYPKQFAKYGAENIRDLQDLVEEDIFAIDDTIGHRGQNNFLGGQNYCTRTDEAPVDDGGAVWFVTLTFETEYQRAV